VGGEVFLVAAAEFGGAGGEVAGGRGLAGGEIAERLAEAADELEGGLDSGVAIHSRS
jgi:hypothetical protein